MTWKENARGIFWRVLDEKPADPKDFDFVVSEAGPRFTKDVQAAYETGKPILLLYMNDPELYANMNLGAWPEPDDDPQIKELDRLLKMQSGTMRKVHGIILDCSKVRMTNGNNLTKAWIAQHSRHMIDMIWKRYRLPIWMYMNAEPLKVWPNSQEIIGLIDDIGISTVYTKIQEVDGYPADGTKPVLPYSGKKGWQFWLYSVARDGWKFLYYRDKKQLYVDLDYKQTGQPEKPEEPEKPGNPDQGAPETDDLGRIAKACERIADALEKLADLAEKLRGLLK